MRLFEERRRPHSGAADLYWRWHLADGDVRELASPPYEERGRAGLRQPHSLLVEWESDIVPGRVHVGTPSPTLPAGYEMSERALVAVARMRNVDQALGALEQRLVNILWLAYGAPIDVELFPLQGPDRRFDPHEPGPALCNLAPLTAAAARAMRTLRRPGSTARDFLAMVGRDAGLDSPQGEAARELARSVMHDARGLLREGLDAYDAAFRLVLERRGGRRWS